MIKFGISHWIKSDNLSIRITREAAGNLVIQVGFAGISLATMLLLTRLLGASGYGVFSNAFAWANIFTVFAPFGFGILLVREIAVLKAQNKWASLKGLIRFSDFFVFVLSLLLIVVLVGIATFVFSGITRENMFLPLIFATPLIPLWAFAILRQSAMRGLERPIHAMLPDTIIRPGATMLGIILFYFIWPDKISSLTAICITVVASAIALGVAITWANKFLTIQKYFVKPVYEIKVWMNSAVPLFLLNSAQIIIAQSPVILLGILSTAENVGLFNVASRLAAIMLYIPLAIGTVVSPIVARMHANGEKEQLQKLLKSITLITFLSDVLLGLGFLLLGEWILSFFGAEFVISQKTMMILIVGCLIDGALGNSSLLLSMTGHERTIAIVFSWAAIANVVTSAFAIPYYGFVGAAFTFTLIMSLIRVMLAGIVMKKLDMNITVFPRILPFGK